MTSARKILALGLLGVLPLLSVWGQDSQDSQEALRIRPEPLAGKEVNRRHVQKTVARALHPREGWTTVERTQETWVSVFTERGSDAGGFPRSKCVIKKISLSESIPATGEEIAWDSENWQVGTPFGARFGPQLDKPFLIRRDERGIPKDVIGVQPGSPITEKIVMSLAAPGEEYAYPAEPIRPGYRWEVEKDEVSPGLGEFTTTGEFEFVGIVLRGTKRVAHIVLKLKIAEQKEGMAGGRVVGGEVVENFYLALDTGAVTEAVSKAVIEVERQDVDGTMIELKTIFEASNVLVEDAPPQ